VTGSCWTSRVQAGPWRCSSPTIEHVQACPPSARANRESSSTRLPCHPTSNG
jgi:hypothetical protein